MKLVRIFSLIVIGLFSGTAAQAATLSNSGFESGLSPWLTIGTVLNPGSVTLSGGATIAPTEGSIEDAHQAELGSNSGIGRFSVLSFLSGLTDIDDLNGFATTSGLTAFENGSVNSSGDLVGENFTSGSAIKQSGIVVAVGEKLSFDFALATQEVSLFIGEPAPDAAFLFADGAFHLLDLATNVSPPALAFGQELSNGYSSFEYTFQTSGPQTIGLVMFNYNNSFAATRLFADNMEFAAVPLPASLPLFVAGLAGLGLISRRRRKI